MTMKTGDKVKWDTVRGVRSGVISQVHTIYIVELPDGKSIKAEESSLTLVE